MRTFEVCVCVCVCVCGGGGGCERTSCTPLVTGLPFSVKRKKLLIGTRNSFQRKPPEEAYFRELDFAVFCIKHITLLFSNGL